MNIVEREDTPGLICVNLSHSELLNKSHDFTKKLLTADDIKGKKYIAIMFKKSNLYSRQAILNKLAIKMLKVETKDLNVVDIGERVDAELPGYPEGDYIYKYAEIA